MRFCGRGTLGAFTIARYGIAAASASRRSLWRSRSSRAAMRARRRGFVSGSLILRVIGSHSTEMKGGAASRAPPAEPGDDSDPAARGGASPHRLPDPLPRWDGGRSIGSRRGFARLRLAARGEARSRKRTGSPLHGTPTASPSRRTSLACPRGRRGPGERGRGGTRTPHALARRARARRARARPPARPPARAPDPARRPRAGRLRPARGRAPRARLDRRDRRLRLRPRRSRPARDRRAHRRRHARLPGAPPARARAAPPRAAAAQARLEAAPSRLVLPVRRDGQRECAQADLAEARACGPHRRIRRGLRGPHHDARRADRQARLPGGPAAARHRAHGALL